LKRVNSLAQRASLSKGGPGFRGRGRVIPKEKRGKGPPPAFHLKALQSVQGGEGVKKAPRKKKNKRKGSRPEKRREGGTPLELR